MQSKAQQRAMESRDFDAMRIFTEEWRARLSKL